MMCVPTGTRMSGAGICGPFPSSENASTMTDGPFAAPGNHRARSTTRRRITVSRRHVPALTRLSLGLTTGGALEFAVARAVGAEAIGTMAASAPSSCRNDMVSTVRARDGKTADSASNPQARICLPLPEAIANRHPPRPVLRHVVARHVEQRRVLPELCHGLERA